MFHGEDIERWGRAAKSVKLVRYGADCYAYGLLALGFCDAVIEADLKLYDFSAHIPIIQGAGGLISDWRGGKPGMAGDGRIIAAGDARLHAQLIEILAS
jgi:inositol-phosphate phosphatase/L-galactose 1-phosphate phosphatase/histidinol-phosphatase